MPPSTKVLLIEDNRLEATQTQHWLKGAKGQTFEVEWVEKLQPGLERLAAGGIDAVLLDLNLPDSRGLETFVKLHDQFPEVPVVVLTGEYDETIGPQAVEQGAQDYLVKQQADAGTLARVVIHALARHRARLEELKKSAREKSAKVFGFIGAKGGCGTTTTALNVALAVAAQHKSVVLAELQPSFGTLSCHLHQAPPKNLRTLLDLPPERIAKHEVELAMSQGPLSSRILFSPQTVEEFKEIDPAQAEAIIKAMTACAEFVFLDLPSSPSAATGAAVRLCQFIAVVTEREPAAVASGRVVIEQLKFWGVGGKLVGAIAVNRTVYPITMDLAEIRSEMGCEIVAVVPWAATACLRALKEGGPLVLTQPENDASITFVDLANAFAADRIQSMSV